MDFKQRLLQNLVIEYFRQRVDTELTVSTGGVYRVALTSNIAQIDFGDREQLSLVFDSARAFEHPESELITVNHPFLDIIRNDLNRDAQANPRLGDAYIFLQLLDPTGQLSIPQLTFSSPTSRVQLRLKYSPTFVLTYRIVYESDQRSENIVRLCYDALSGIARPQLVEQLQDISLVDGIPVEARDALGNLGLAAVMELAQQELESRVRADVQLMHHEVNSLLEQEKLRLSGYYKKQIALAYDEVSREQLQTTLEKDIADLERKLACHVRIQLLSVLRLWWPTVDYKLTVSTRRGDFEVSPISYSAQSSQTTFRRCDTCDNSTHYDICTVNQHVLCGGACSQGLTECATCHEVYCVEHGSLCAHCGEPACRFDRSPCHYGDHPPHAYYCPQCRVASFEGHTLCPACLDHCEQCQRPFPHALIGICRVGQERICHGHDHSPDGGSCQECGALVCHLHGVHTAERSWVCADHVREATCCGRQFGRSRVVACVVDGAELLCPDHLVRCRSCAQPVCEAHRFALHAHSSEFVCATCRRTCQLCPPEWSYVAADLATCETGKEAVCVAHRARCASGGEIVCRTHLRLTKNREPLCPTHAAQCVQCGTGASQPFHRLDRLKVCVVCRQQACNEHVSICQVCQRYALCTVHQPALPACAGCGSGSCGYDGCSPQSHSCRRCGVSYCHHCLTPGNQCVTCEAVRDSTQAEAWMAFLREGIGGMEAEAAKALSTMLESPANLSIREASNKSYQVVVVRYTPPWYAIWKSPQQLRVLVSVTGTLTRASVEQPDER